jgi:eukaryotic-like serine/threonine-protein kinase
MDDITQATIKVPDRGAEGREAEWPARPATPSPFAPGYVVAGRYQVERALGEGGAGRVWLARDLEEPGEVAIKELFRRQGRGEDDHRSALLLRREFFAMRRLEHPATVKVFDAGVLEGGHRYLVMEMVHGRRLDEEVAEGPAGPERACEVLMRLAEVLAFIHARSFVHCDVKGGNVMVASDRSLKLLDFGIMHPLGARPAGAFAGTPAYTAPEWQRGEPIDGRADLYSLGVLGYQLATGRLPFAGRSVAHLLDAHLLSEPPPPSEFAPVDPALERILLRLLAKKPAARYADAAELLAALAEVSGRPPPPAPLAARTSYLRLPRAVGRDAEMARLAARIDDALAGRARALFVTAPGGVGKSHLLGEFELKARAYEMPFAVGQCRVEGLAPLAPLAQALRALAAATPPALLDPFRPALAGLLRRDGAAPPRAEIASGARLDALVAWLRALGGERPFVLALEDLHWADAATLEHLNVVVRALDGTRGLLVGTFRPDEVDRTSLLHQTFDEGLADRLALAPLSPRGLTELVGEALGGLAVPPELIGRLYAATSGNAFFVIECLRLLIEQDALCLAGGRWQALAELAALPLPAAIEGAVRARASALPPPLLGFLRRLAPAGRKLELSLVRAVADLPDAELFATLDEGLTRHFLTYARGHYFFAHDTLQRALYDDTPAADRAAHHRRIAEALEATRGDDAAEAVGYHFARSDQPFRAIAPLVRASQRARANNALLDATLSLARAAELLEAHEDYPDRDRLLPALWAELVESGYASDPPTCLRYAERLLATWDASGLTERGRREALAALEAARAGDPATWGERLAGLYRPARGGDLGPRDAFVKVEEYRMYQCIARGVLGRVAEASALLARIDAEQPPESPFRAASATARGVMSVHLGDSGPLLAAQRSAVERLLALKRQAGELPRPLAWGLGITTYVYNVMLAQRGEPVDAEARAAGAELGARYGLHDIALFHVLAELGRAAFAGDGPTFRRLSAEVSERTWRLGNPRLPERNAIVFMAPYYFERGELDAAEELAATAERVSTRLPADRWLGCYVLLYRACVEALRGGEGGDAMRRAKQAAAELDFRHLTLLLVYESRAALARGDRDAARAGAEAAFARATDPRLANPFDEIVARRALAALGGPAAREHLARAARLAAATDNVLQDGLVHLELAESWAAHARDRDRALANLARAEASFARAGASICLARAERLRRGALAAG